MAQARPQDHEFAQFYAGYVALVPEDDILDVLTKQIDIFRAIAKAVPPERETFAYAPDKWTIRQVFGHISDGERVFGHRAFCIARGEQASLPGFDEQAYMAESGCNTCPLPDLVEELVQVRHVNLTLLRKLPPEGWRRMGVANGNPVSVMALAYMLAGHARHHLGVLRDRYGVSNVARA